MEVGDLVSAPQLPVPLLGAGVQSTTLLVHSQLDGATFSDTG